jgi:uncharacterized protein (DUF1501 family)
MNRRDFLKILGVTPVLFSLPRAGWSTAVGSGAEGASGRRVLVLIELDGGNDGLNTLVPYADSAYYAARPGLAVARDRVLPLTERVGLNPVMAPLMDAWSAEELAWIEGVGYETPNRSHFRSLDIWETASDSEEFLDRGWLTAALGGSHLSRELSAEGVILGSSEVGPFLGEGARALVMDDADDFLAQASALRAPPSAAAGGSAALQHLLGVQADVVSANQDLERRLRGAPAITEDFGRRGLGPQLETATRLITADVPVAVIKLTLGGFDNHANQRARHDGLLEELATGLATFRAAMERAGRWNDVLVVTYSEFGRRVAENGSGGTDHGAAAAHLAMGGAVRGGLYGGAPSLTDLDQGDLRHTVDFRSIYATICRRWWGVDPSVIGAQGHPVLDLLG